MYASSDAVPGPPPAEQTGPHRPCPRTTAAQREATITALIVAARALFAERRCAGVGAEEIVQRAEVTRSALCHHIRGGEKELFGAVRFDGPSVLGWDAWHAIDQELGDRLVEEAIQRPMDADRLLSQPADAPARVLRAHHDAAMVVVRAEAPAAARREMGRTARRLLDGFRGPLAGGS